MRHDRIGLNPNTIIVTIPSDSAHRITTRVTQFETGRVARGTPEKPNEVKQQINALLDQRGDEFDPHRYHHLLQLAGSMREVMTTIIMVKTNAPSDRVFERFRLHGKATTVVGEEDKRAVG